MLTTTAKKLALAAGRLQAWMTEQGWRGDVATVFAGIFTSLGFAPVNRFYLPLITLALLHTHWLLAAPRQAFWRGWLFGMGLFGSSLGWVYVAMDEFGNMGDTVAVLFTLLFVASLSLYVGATGWLLRRYFPVQTPVPFVLAAAALWTLLEWVRGWFLTGFPWLLAGYSQMLSPLSEYAPVWGVYGVSWLTLVCALIVMFCARQSQWIDKPQVNLAAGLFALVLSLWTLMLLQYQPQWFFNKFLYLVDLFFAAHVPVLQAVVHGLLQLSVWVVVFFTLLALNFFVFRFAVGFVESLVRRRMAWALVLIFAGGALLQWVPWSTSQGVPLRATLLQGNTPQDTKWQPSERAKTMDLYARLMAEHMTDDIVVLSESALPVYQHQIQDNYLASFDARGKQTHTALVIGLPVLDLETDRYYNAMAVYGDGHGTYLKHHLVPFGEYIPLKSTLGNLLKILNVPMSDFSAGSARQEWSVVRGFPVAITICYEDIFPEEVIHYLPKAQLLINASNNAWYGDSLAPHQHLQIAQMRAKETSRYVLRATTNGISAIIDHHGELLAHSAQFKLDVTTHEVYARTGATPYVLYGNSVIVLMMFASLAWVRRIRSQEQRLAVSG